MSFDSIGAFLAMGGHGLYVWLAYGIGVIVIAVIVLAPIQARRRLFAVETERAGRSGAEQKRKAYASDPP